MAEQPISERVNRLGVEYRNGLIENMAKVLDNRPLTGAEKIGPQRELELWMTPTSPAAVIALQRGATMAEANEANALWAQMMAQQGAPEELIFETCRKFAWERGKTAARGDLKREVEYHQRMSQRALALQMGSELPEDDDTEGEEEQDDAAA